MNNPAYDQQLEKLERTISGLEDSTRKALLIAVADLLESLLPESDPLGGERRPDSAAVPTVRELEIIANRLRASAKRAQATPSR